MFLFSFGQRRHHSELHEEFSENHAMQVVELCPRKLSFADFVHGGLVAGTPPVGESAPVEFDAFCFAPRLAFFDNGTAPIHNCSERVKDECFRHDSRPR